MRVQVVHIEACPGWERAGALAREVLDRFGRSDVPVEYVTIRSEADAAAVAFAGSPTLLVDGEDLFPSGPRTHALACRVYPTEQGLSGSPTRAQLETALRARLGVGGRA
ncbi:hypothetical protein [Agromyces sp. SYSU T00194]|uniref:hypothetical protein n=1 Tax=Agromyces chitinivorans TaxID=3158560 RepID=UPI00339986D5